MLIEDAVGIFVTKCYQVILERGPDPSGLEHYIRDVKNRGATPVMLSLFLSDEYANLYPTDEAFVESLYDKLLHRASDPPGHRNWVTSLRERGKEHVVSGIINSSEFSETMNGAVDKAGSLNLTGLNLMDGRIITEDPNELDEWESLYVVLCIMAKAYPCHVVRPNNGSDTDSDTDNPADQPRLNPKDDVPDAKDIPVTGPGGLLGHI